MRKASPGVICVLLGVVLLLAALGLYGYNRWEDAQAGAEAQTVVQDLQEKVVEQTQSAASAPAIDTSSLDPELPVVELDGYEYVGTVSIPAIGIDLPVMCEWSYPKLKISPCRQFGSSRTDDLVIAAHNYESHFGKIGTLALGDEVRFTDMDGIENHYTVSALKSTTPPMWRPWSTAATIWCCTPAPTVARPASSSSVTEAIEDILGFHSRTPAPETPGVGDLFL